jgi:hypothetical protein
MNYGTLDTPNSSFLELIASWRSGHRLLSYFIQKSNAPTIVLLLLAILQSEVIQVSVLRLIVGVLNVLFVLAYILSVLTVMWYLALYLTAKRRAKPGANIEFYKFHPKLSSVTDN